MAVTSDRPGLLGPIADTEWLDQGRRRSPLWAEALVIVWLCWLYDAVNNLSPLRLHTALAHATSLLHFENVWHLNPELSLNAWAATHRAIALPMADFYDSAHFVVTLGLVALLWWRYPDLYRPLRNSLVLINVIGFVVFWLYPLAPPRMMAGAGFVDVVAVTHAWGSWRTSAVASQANELAAMPSLHVAWACWTAMALWRILRGRRGRVLVVAYPVMTALIVMATANHFLLDVVAGLATVVAAYGLATLLGMIGSWRPFGVGVGHERAPSLPAGRRGTMSSPDASSSPDAPTRARSRRGSVGRRLADRELRPVTGAAKRRPASP